MPLLLSSRSTCLTACLVTRPRACASAWPIVATASDAAVIAPSVAPARDAIRLPCKSDPYNPPMNDRTSSKCPHPRTAAHLAAPTALQAERLQTPPNRAYTQVNEIRGFVRPMTCAHCLPYSRGRHLRPCPRRPLFDAARRARVDDAGRPSPRQFQRPRPRHRGTSARLHKSTIAGRAKRAGLHKASSAKVAGTMCTDAIMHKCI